jgi:hypothetical protein
MKTTETENPLRWRFCRAADCGALFFVCKHCDRGQRYCSEGCRNEGRRKSRSEASSRYQRSESGRIRHLLRQRAYRHKRSKASVTHQGYQQSIPPIHQAPSATPKCAFCHVENRWTDPFDQMSPRLWRKFLKLLAGPSPKKYVFT